MEGNKIEYSKEKEIIQNNTNDEDIISQLDINLDKIKNNIKKYANNNNCKELVILIESGSLAPPHKMHLGIMEITKKYFEQDETKIKVVICGFLVPSSDNYVMNKLKNDFIPLNHRVNMTKLMIKNSNWLECLNWGFSSGGRIKKYIDLIIKKEFPEYNIKSYLVFKFLYSSIESTLTLPRFLISVCKVFTLFCVALTFSGFSYSTVAFGVSSYSTHSLFISSFRDSSNLFFFISNFTNSDFSSSMILNSSACSFSFGSYF